MSRGEVKMKQQEYNTNWIAVLWYLHLHFLAPYAFWLVFTEAKWMTLLFVSLITAIACIGVTVGAHRYYAHRAFAATTPLRFFFVLAHTLGGVGSMFNSVLLHRMHHKYFGTDNDPYNYKKGFIYSHFISNCKTGYEKNTELVKTIDVRDIENDIFVWIQDKLYNVLFIFVTLIFPINIPIAYWDESFLNSIIIMIVIRLVIVANVSWLVNSAIIVWGLKPTDKYPVDDFSVFFLSKSYWLNYHYIFPRDWKSSEFGKYDTGCGTILIKFLYELGLIDTLMTMSSEHARESLYKIASKKLSVKDAIDELEKLSSMEAVRQNLQYKH